MKPKIGTHSGPGTCPYCNASSQTLNEHYRHLIKAEGNGEASRLRDPRYLAHKARLEFSLSNGFPNALHCP